MVETSDTPLRRWRKAQNWTLEQAAEAFGMKSKGQLSEIEQGTGNCSVAIALTIERITGGEVLAHALHPDVALVRAA